MIQCWEAVENHLFRTIGASAIKNGQRFERLFRDLAVSAAHRNTQLREDFWRQLGAIEFGVPTPSPAGTYPPGTGPHRQLASGEAEHLAVRAAVLAELGAPLIVEELALRPPGDHEVIVRTEATAFCITDCLVTRGELGFPQPPTILGHSAVGTVQEAGPGVTRVKAGDRVVMPASPECGKCYWCVRERPDQCAELLVPARHVADRADGTPVTAEVGGVGSYAEYMNLREISVFAVQSDLPAETLSLVGCGITSGLGAVFNAAQVTPGSSVAIVGAGISGCG